ncbi:acyltransferase family protein [Maribacter aurantiacus]|uniref:Acyltransferase n=1 Tax=Maribacter aurantiacus TaxID=1882343 RepID=A0A5R8MAA6_9FLAO|nr:acyltransferase [Maribacter aurantiacus]TLF46476.1 acyltransferase [Maribacter aurantiacus]
MNYRKDIDGLRAIAVLVVIFCHLGMGLFKGGFLGVDVFFVISGFLITYNITQKLNENKFSFKKFYLNRVKRIAPVLIVILVLLTVFNLLVLLPQPLKNYLEFLPYASIGLGNYAAANLNSGYFDAVSERYQLLHTWSLGVEEQFYLFVPLLFFLLWKIRNQKYRNGVIVLIYILSIAVSVYFVRFTEQSKSNYYLLHTRFFEIFTGSMLAVFYHKGLPVINSKKGLGLLYIISLGGMLLFSYVFDGTSLWPGLNAFWISLLTILIIFLGKEENATSWGKQFLEYPAMRFIGKISYSLYLWHWIIIATLVEIGYDVNHFSLLTKLLLLCVIMIPLSYLSWKYIENVFRYRLVFNFSASLVSWVLVPLLLAVGLYKYQELHPDTFYPKSEIDATTYQFSSKITPHLKVDNPMTKEVRAKHAGVEYLLGDYNMRRRQLERDLTISDAEVLVLANSHFHAFKNFINNQLKDKGLIGHVMHENTGFVYAFEDAKRRYQALLKGKRFVVIWVKLDNIKLNGTKMKWEKWILEEALAHGVQPIFYVPGIEMASENEARKNIYQNILFGKSANDGDNLNKLFGDIPTLEYTSTLFEDYGDSVRWVDFKPLMCYDSTCKLWLNDTFALFDKHHITRQFGYELGREFDFKYDNIFEEDWKQPPLMFNEELLEYDWVREENNNEIYHQEQGYTIKIDLADRTYQINKEYSEQDFGSMFFVHVYPEDINMLPEHRKRHKFDNLDAKGEAIISFIEKDTFFYGKNKLPDYKIKSIHLGHFKPKGDRFFDKTFDIP